MSAPLQLPRTNDDRAPMRRPTLGVYLDRPPLDIDPRGMQDCLNVRIRRRRVHSDGMGYEKFPQFASSAINLDAEQVLHIDEYRARSGSTIQIFANKYDVFRYNPGTETVTYMTPTYITGTAAATGGDNEVDGTDTFWDTAKTTTPIDGGYGNNVRAGDEIHFGTAGEDDPTLTWYVIESIADDETLVLESNPGVQGLGDYTIRQKLQGDNNDIWESETFQDSQEEGRVGEDVYYVTNGVEALSWDGVEPTFQWHWPGYFFKNLLAHKQTLVTWNLVDAGVSKPGAIRYSEMNHPENMATNGAGETLPADGVLDLLNVVPIGDALACYFQGDIVMMQYVGPPLFFIARVAVPGVGLQAQRAIMDFGDYHEFLSKDGVYRFDGVSIKEAMPQVFRKVLTTAAPNLIKKAYAYLDRENAEVIWSLPLTTDGQAEDEPPATAFVEHYLEDNGPYLPTPMTIRDWPFTAVGFYEAASSLTFADFPATAFEDSALQWSDRTFQQSFPFMIAGDADGNIWILNTTNTKDGAAVESFAHFPRFAAGDGDMKGLIKYIEPYTTRRQGAGYDLGVEVRFFDYADGDSIESVSLVHDLSHSGLRYTPVRKAGRYADIRYRTTGLDALDAGEAQPWDLAGHEVKVTGIGNR